MIPRKLFIAPFVGLLVVVMFSAPVVAAYADEPADLYKAYFLEHQSKDYAAARQLYDKVLDAGTTENARRIAQAGADRCRDQLAAANFAGLMPENALIYVELNRPGQVFEQLAGMLGLTGKDLQAVLAQRPNSESTAQFHIPQEVVISPALLEYLGSFGGGALAITDLDPEDGPRAGVLVVHHGDVKFFKGLIETAFQFLPTTEKIADMPTFTSQAPDLGKVTGILTEGLFIVGTGRELVEGVVDRLTGKETASLGTREDLKEVARQRVGATLFAYVDLQSVLKIAKGQMSEGDRREFAAVNAICDLDSLRWATFAAGIHEGVMGLQMSVRLADDHHSLAYNLMRLPPMNRKCLEHVPPDAAAFFGIGLNPAWTLAAVDTAKGARPDSAVTGFDIGREFFGNIQEVCAFILPGKMIQRGGDKGPPVIPNIGVVLAVNDAAKSRALWSQLLAIPGMIAGEKPITPKSSRIGDHEVTTFEIPDFGKLYLAELDGCMIFGATRGAMKAALSTHDRKRSILSDKTMAPVIARMPKDSSIMLVGHVGRLAKVAAGAGDASVAMAATQAAELCGDTVVWAGLGQSPSQMTFQAALKGLPNVNKALQKFGPMLTTLASLAQSGGGTDEEPDEADVNALTAKVIEASEKGNLEDALGYALKARDAADIGLTNYNVACMYSRLGEKDKAFEYLFRAAEQRMPGRDMAEMMRQDRDFENIRKDPRFEKALEIVQSEPKRALDRDDTQARRDQPREF